MEMYDHIKQNGDIPVFTAEDIIRYACANYDLGKPSSRILKSKVGLKALALLKEIEKNYNKNYYQIIYDRVVANGKLDSVAIFYRGTKITYREMFSKADEMAKAFITKEIKQGDKIACCLSNTPELIYTMLAANRLGINLDLTNSHFDAEFLEERYSFSLL